MSEDTVRILIVTLFGAGGATFIWTVVKSIIAYRDSAEGREDRAVARLERFEEDCRSQLAHERVLVNYWCQWAGTLEYALRTAGVTVPERPDMPVHPDQDKGL